MTGDAGAPVVVIVGATGVGKSDAAVALATRLGGEVINADSMQVYRGMDIGTAKLSLNQRQGVPHRLIDVWDVAQEANVAAYQTLARSAIDEIRGKGRVPILVGGSGLYVNAAIDDLQFPGHDPKVRAQLQRELAEHGSVSLHTRLARLDPEAASGILPSNGRRIVRALEVWHVTGAAPRTRLPQPESIYPVVIVGLALPTPILDDRLALRVRTMWRRGFVAEVAALGEQLRVSPTARFALGYRQILEHLDGERSEEDAFDATIRATRKFARRQNSWFGRDSRIRWLDAADPALTEQLLETVEQGISSIPESPSTPRLLS